MQPYLAAQLAGDSREALAVVIERGVEAGVPVSELQLQVVQPAQREIGRLWQENLISVAQEHLATSISQLVVSRLYSHMPRERPNGKHVLVACVEGELHDVGARMGADFLEMAGFEVRFLGANVATAALGRALGEGPVDVLGLSASMSFHEPALRAAVREARRVKGEGLPILVGGGLVRWAPGLREELGVEAFGESADTLVERCRRRLRC
ncbi:MAG: cobalamin-dependent protein [Polyangiaceae bacterium]|nr:cobalamin-dependent protein [Polyangiaceae bacterium]